MHVAVPIIGRTHELGAKPYVIIVNISYSFTVDVGHAVLSAGGGRPVRGKKSIEIKEMNEWEELRARTRVCAHAGPPCIMQCRAKESNQSSQPSVTPTTTTRIQPRVCASVVRVASLCASLAAVRSPPFFRRESIHASKGAREKKLELVCLLMQIKSSAAPLVRTPKT